MPVAKNDCTVTFGVVGGLNKLPKYDAKGNKYVYFAKENMTGNTEDYAQSIYNVLGFAQKDCILDGGTITNKKQADITPTVTKKIEAAAMQAAYGTISVGFELQRKLADDTEWTVVKDSSDNPVTVNVSGFSNTSLQITQAYTGSQPKYDDNGYQYTYRSIEISMTISGRTVKMDSYIDEDSDSKTAVIPGDVGPDGTTAIFKVIREEDGTITDRLIGETQIKIEKEWNPENSSGVAHFNITRNDNTSTANGTLKDRDGNTVQSPALTGNSTAVIDNLERYDEDGKEYVYTVTETGMDNASGYALQEESHSKATVVSGETKVVQLGSKFVNKTGDKEDLVFDVEKQWFDDSDLLHRNNVTAAVYRITDSDGNKVLSEVAGSEAVLNDANLWKAQIHIAKADGDDTTANYVVLEKGVTESDGFKALQNTKASYTANELNALISSSDAGIKDQTAVKVGTLETTEHYYNVYTYKNTDKTTEKEAYYVLTNQRYGSVTLNLTKTWITPDSEGPKAVFKLMQYSSDPDVVEKAIVNSKGTVTFTLDGGTSKTADWTSDGYTGTDQKLEKYDSLGRAYSYGIIETGMYNSVGTLVAVENGTAEIDGDCYKATVSSAELKSTINQKYSEFHFEAENTRSETMHIVINKVWQDDGSTKSPARPDISFNLYRTTSYTVQQLNETSIDDILRDTGENGQIEKVSFDNLWDTTKNDWWWTDDLGYWDRYDGNGNRYVYFLTETMLSNADDIYNTAYYNGSEKPHGISGSVTTPTTENTFDISYSSTEKASSFSSKFLIVTDGSESDPSSSTSKYSKTVVNYRKAERDLSGTKIWQNLPSAFKTANLPSITINLYRSLSDDKEELYKEKYYYCSTTLDCRSTSTFTFTQGVDDFDGARYDGFGRMYYYGVQEASQLNGYKTNEKQAANDFVITNTYKLSSPDKKVQINFSKTWTVDEAYTKAMKADTTFTLYRSSSDKNGNVIADSVELVNTQTVSPANDDGTSQTQDYVFTKDSANNPLPYYGPNGYPYIYSVEETVPYGYTASLNGGTAQSAGTQLSSNALTLDENTVTHVYENTTALNFVNTYNTSSGNTTTITATKNWSDFNNLYKLRPSELVLTLYRKYLKNDGNYADETVTTATITIDSLSSQSHEFTGLLEYAPNGNKYTYYIKEAAPTGDTESANALKNYTSATVEGNPSCSITNTLPGTTVTAVKEWKTKIGEITTDMTDAEIDRFCSLGVFSGSLTFKVQYSNDGTSWQDLTYTDSSNVVQTVAQTKVLNNNPTTVKSLRDNGVVFNELPKYITGTNEGTDNEVKYRIIEDVSGNNFTSAVTASPINSGSYVISNTLQVRQIRITKKWVDNHNQDNTRPESITVTLKRDNLSTETSTLTLNASNASSDSDTWTTGLIDVPLNKTGSSDYSVYTVSEAAVTGYESPVLVSGKVTGDPVNTADNYSDFTFTNTLTNLTPSVITISATKAWSDGILQDISRPSTVYFTLFVRDWDSQNNRYMEGWSKATSSNCGTSVSATQAVDPAAASTVSWSGVLKNHVETNAVSVPMEYKVEETDAQGEALSSSYPYACTSSVDVIYGTAESTAVTLTNTVKTVSVSITKTWQTIAGSTVTAMSNADKTTYFEELPKQLRYTVQYKNGETWTDVMKNGAAYTVDADISTEQNLENYTGSSSQTDLPQYTAQGTAIEYRLKETAVNMTDSPDTGWIDINASNMTVSYEQDTVTNAITLGSVTVSKTWLDEVDRDGKQTGSITVQLKRDGQAYGEAQTINKEQNDTWPSYTWTNLPVYQKGSTDKSVYTVTETEVSGYETQSTSVTADTSNAQPAASASTIQVTNSYVPDTFTLHAEKIWSDYNNAYDTRTAVSFTLQYQNTQGNWVNVQKSELNNDFYPDDGVYTTSEVTQSLGAGTSAEWDNCRKNVSGTPIVYRVVETGASDVYTASYAYTNAGQSDQVAGTFTAGTGSEVSLNLTNTMNTTSVTVIKIWQMIAGNTVTDMVDADKTTYFEELPKQLRYTAQYKNGETWTDVMKNGAAYTVYADISTEEKLKGYLGSFVEDLPACNADGSAVEYRLKETAVNMTDAPDTGWIDIDASNMTVSYEQNTVANAITLGSVTVSKTWLDEVDRDGERTGSISVQLMRDGTVYGEKKTIVKNQDGTWPTYTWTNLPVYQKGSTSKSQYTVVEDSVDEYETVISSSVTADVSNVQPAMNTSTIQIANTHVPDTFTLEADKIWDDNSNGYDTRSEISFTLQYQDTEGNWIVVAQSTLNDDLYGDDGVYTSSQNPKSLGNGTRVIWNDLRKNVKGAPIVYRVVETDASDAYEVSYAYTGAEQSVQVPASFTNVTGNEVSLELTNTLKKVSLTVNKEWNDLNNLYLARPDTDITVQLQSRTSENEEWTDIAGQSAVLKYDTDTKSWDEAVFSDLDAQDSHGNWLMYQAVEIEVPASYQTSSENTDSTHCLITNTLVYESRYTAVLKKHSVTLDGTLLDGAGFIVRRVKKSALARTETYEYCSGYDSASNTALWTDEQSQAKIFVTGTDNPYVLGQVSVPGLTFGEYSVIEVQAPSGYDLNDPVSFIINGQTEEDSVAVAQADPLLPKEEVTTDIVDTSDQNNNGMWLVILIAALAAVIGMIVVRRKK